MKKYSNQSLLNDSREEVTSTKNNQIPSTSPEKKSLIHNETSFEIQKILNHKDRPGKSTLYLVEWKEYGNEDGEEDRNGDENEDDGSGD